MKRRANRRPVPSRRHLLRRRLVNRLRRRRPGPSNLSSPEPGGGLVAAVRRWMLERDRLKIDARNWDVGEGPSIHGDTLST